MLAVLATLGVISGCDPVSLAMLPPMRVGSAQELEEKMGGGGPLHLLLGAGEYELQSTLVVGNCSRIASSSATVLRLNASIPHPVLAVHQAAGVTIEGITIAGHSHPQRAAAVEVVGGESVLLHTLKVTGGVAVRGGSGHTLTRSSVSNPHGNCVYYSKAGDPITLSSCNHSITHTEIHDCRGLGNPWPSSVLPCHNKPGQKPCPVDPYPNITGTGVLLNQIVGANVSHNYIHDTNYHGVYTQGRWHSRYPDPSETPSALNTVALNRIENFGQCTQQPLCNVSGQSGNNGQPGADPACIYHFDGWGTCCYGQMVENNLCILDKPGMKGVYVDGTSSGITARGNMLVNVTGNVIDNNDGHDNKYYANIVVGGHSMGSLTDSNFWGNKDGPFALSDQVGHSCTPNFWNKYNNSGTYNLTRWVSTWFESPAWRSRFPEIQTWFKRTEWNGVNCDPKDQGTDCCMFPTGTVANYSVMVNVDGKNWQNISSHYCGNTHAFDPPVGCWPDQAGFQTVGPQKLYTVDPGFVDLKGGNYALRPDSVIFKDFPGFPQFPFDRVGPQPPLTP